MDSNTTQPGPVSLDDRKRINDHYYKLEHKCFDAALRRFMMDAEHDRRYFTDTARQNPDVAAFLDALAKLSPLYDRFMKATAVRGHES